MASRADRCFVERLVGISGDWGEGALDENLTLDETRCFGELFRASHWKDMAQWERNILADAKIARVDLKLL